MVALYRLTEGSTVVRTTDELFIPNDPANVDWQDYLAWVAAGNTPDPIPSPAPPDAVLPQDIIAQMTPDDFQMVQAAIGVDKVKLALWYAFLAQKDPMRLNNARFIAGWNALTAILGATRTSQIATVLGLPL